MLRVNNNGVKVEYSVVLLVLILSTSISWSSVVPAFGKIQNINQIVASPLTAETPKVILQSGIAGTSTIYADATSAKVSVVAPITYYPNGYSISTGTHVSGSVPASVQTVDTNYFIVRSSGTATSTQMNNPSGNNLIGSTTYVSGNIENLASNDGAYMTFRSYISATSATSKTDAFMAYRSNTGNLLNYPKYRLWEGDTASWGNEVEMNTADSPVRWVRTAICPKSERALEKIVVTLSDDGYLDAYLYDGISWTVTNNIASVWATAPASPIRPYDVAYETASGTALLVYDVNIADATKDLGYKIWNGISWSQEYYIDFTGVAATYPVVSFIILASNPDPSSNQIAIAFNESSKDDAFAAIWNGTSWTSMTTLTTANTISTKESIAIVYSTYYKKTVVLAGNGANSIAWKTYTQGDTNWVTQTAFDPDPDDKQEVCFGTLKSDPSGSATHDYIMYSGVNDYTDLNLVLIDVGPSTPTVTSWGEFDDDIDSNVARPCDFDWEQTGSKGLVVWGTTAGSISYMTFTAPSTWSSISTETMGTNTHPWIQLKHNTRNVNGDMKILGAVLEATANDLGAIKWDGTTLTVIGASTFTADTSVSTYESFDLEFQLFGDPEFTSEIEFTGTTNTWVWTQLVWTVDSALIVASVNVTMQLYNYAQGYPTNGNGYLTYISSATADTDETKTQTITTNPTDFRSSSGEWKIKIKCVKTSDIKFDFKADWIEFKPTYYSQYTVSTEFTFSNMITNTPTQLNFTVVSQYDISSVSVTIQVWNYSSPSPSYVTSGEGYLTYTSAGANETKLLSINLNPQFYTSGENAKIKITGVLTSTTQYQQKINRIKLDYRYSSSSTYDYVLKIANLVTGGWKVNMRVYGSSDVARLLNATISFHDGSTSNQIIIDGGVITQSEGPQYNLAASATIYISISNLQTNTTGASYLYVYLKILFPGTSVYSLYIITFQIT